MHLLAVKLKPVELSLASVLRAGARDTKELQKQKQTRKRVKKLSWDRIFKKDASNKQGFS